MIKANTLTFEQVESHLHKWGKVLSNNRFEEWELINSAWLYGKIRFLPQSKIKFASLRIRYDMLDYIRRVSKSRERQLALKKGRAFPVFYNFSDTIPISPVEDGEAFETTLEAKNIGIEQKDLIHYLTSHPSFSRLEKLIMKLMYIEGFSQVLTAKVCGFHFTQISQMHTNIMARLRTLDYSKITGQNNGNRSKHN